MVIIESKKAKGLCVAYRCMKKSYAGYRFCHKHHKRHFKQTNPVGYHYGTLRQNAKRRGKEFTLTIDEFRTFCEETNYLEKKGKHKRAASIDRIDPNRGYSIDNIQILSLSENSKKGTQEQCPF